MGWAAVGTIAADEVVVAVEDVAVDVAAESFCGMNNESRVARHKVCNVGCEWRGCGVCVCVCAALLAFFSIASNSLTYVTGIRLAKMLTD